MGVNKKLSNSENYGSHYTALMLDHEAYAATVIRVTGILTYIRAGYIL